MLSKSWLTTSRPYAFLVVCVEQASIGAAIAPQGPFSTF